jgi:LPXTG-motif cell wall-anchored protein
VKRLIAAAALTVVMLAAPAGAQQYPPSVNELTVTCPPAGSRIEVRARTFGPGTEVAITIASEPIALGTAVADADGIAALAADLPSQTPVGDHTVTATGVSTDGSALTVTGNVTIAAGPTCGTAGAGGTDTPDSGALPRTGDDSSIPLAKVGLTLAAVGGVITAVATKRRKRVAAAG